MIIIYELKKLETNPGVTVENIKITDIANYDIDTEIMGKASLILIYDDSFKCNVLKSRIIKKGIYETKEKLLEIITQHL